VLYKKNRVEGVYKEFGNFQNNDLCKTIDKHILNR
jgi:hypothetical protein